MAQLPRIVIERGSKPMPIVARNTDVALRRLAADQHGVVGHHQVRSLGLSELEIEAQLRRRYLIAVHRGVYRVAGAPSSWLQDLLAACSSTGPQALASHRSAARLWRLDGAGSSGTIEVVTSRSLRRDRAGFTTHQSTDLRLVDAAVTSGVAVTSPTRTLLDVGAVVHRYRLEQAPDAAAGWSR
jgi:hypothetical protein